MLERRGGENVSFCDFHCEEWGKIQLNLVV